MPIHRVVAEEHRALGLGFLSFISRLLGGIPGPLIVGVLFDITCQYWQYECGERGNCWVYDSQTLAYYVFGFSFGILSICTALSTATWLTYPKSRDHDEEERKNSKDKSPSSPAKAVGDWDVEKKGEKLRDEDCMSKKRSLPDELTLHDLHAQNPADSPV